MAIVAPPRERTQPRPDDTTTRGGGWHVVAFNNDYNTFAEVIEILIVATGCTREEAEIETWEIDRFGSGGPSGVRACSRDHLEYRRENRGREGGVTRPLLHQHVPFLKLCAGLQDEVAALQLKRNFNNCTTLGHMPVDRLDLLFKPQFPPFDPPGAL